MTIKDDFMFKSQDILNRIKFNFLYIDVLASCNLRCKHCLFQINPGDLTGQLLSQDERKKLINKAVAYGIKRILLSGKELFLIPKITLELLSHLSTVKNSYVPHRASTEHEQSKFQFGFISNGTLVKEEHVALIPKDIGWIDVSMEGTKEYHERLRGEGTFHKSLKTIDRFIAANLPVSIAFTSTSLNDEGIGAGIEEFIQHGVKKYFISHYVPLKINDPLRLPRMRLTQLIQRLRRIAQKYHDIKLLFELEAPQAVALIEQGECAKSDIFTEEGSPHEFYVLLEKNFAIKWQRIYNFFMHDVRVSPDGWVITCEEEHQTHYHKYMTSQQSINIRDCDFDFTALEQRIKTEKKIFYQYLKGIETHECRNMYCFEYCYGGNQYARFVLDKQWSKQSMNCEKTLV